MRIVGTVPLLSHSLLALTLALALSCGSVAAEEQDVTPAKIGPGVREALENGDASVRVVVALEDPRGGNGDSFDLKEYQAQVSAVQDALLLGKAGTDGLETLTRYTSIPALVLTASTLESLDVLELSDVVTRVDVDVGGSADLESAVPLIGSDERLDMGNDGTGVTVAVLDNGVQANHPSLQDSVVAEECFCDTDGSIDGNGECPNGSDRQSGTGSARDDSGHGTHVAGIVTAPPGGAPGADIVVVKVLYGTSTGGVFSFFSEIVAALDWVIANHATNDIKIVNMSLSTNARFAGNCNLSTSFTMAGAAAVASLNSLGITVFASAGNNGDTTMGAPGCLGSVISVGSSDDNDEAASFTNSNFNTKIFAPGVSIQSTGLGDSDNYVLSGTSMSSPLAASCAALLIDSGEATTPSSILTRLQTSGVMVESSGRMFPRIDCSLVVDPPIPPVGFLEAIIDVFRRIIEIIRNIFGF